MLNVTARLALKIEIFQTGDDAMPQRSRSSLTFSPVLKMPNETAIQFTMEFLVQEFKCLKSISPHVPPRQSPHPVKTPTVAPMPILFRDEKYKAETIEIIGQLMDDAKLSGNSQVNYVD